MDKPSREVYDKDDNRSVTRPKLGELEKGVNSSNASEDLYKPPGNSSNQTTEQLQKQEKTGSWYSPNSSTGGGPKTTTTQITKIKITKWRAAAAGGVVAGSVGLFAFFNIAQGPFQFIHFAQMLQQFHLSGHEDAADDRISRLYRFYKSGGDVRQTRVGYLGSRMAPKIEAKFQRAGILVDDGNPLRIANSFELDRTHPKWSSLSDAELQDYARRNRITINIENGRAIIPIPSSIFSRSGPVIKWALKESGTYKVMSPIQTRVFGRWAGVTWHPLRRTDARVNEKVGDYYRRVRDTYDKKIARGAIDVRGSTGRLSEPGEDATDEERRAYQEAKEYADEADRAVAEIRDQGRSVAGETTDRQEKLIDFRDSLKSKLTTTGIRGALITAVICVLHEMNEIFESLKNDRLILPLMRLAWHSISMGNQAMNGTDADIEQLGAYNDLFHDPANGSWQSSRTMQAEQGKPQTGPPVDDTLSYITKKSPFAFIDNIPGIGQLCSTVGQIIVGVITVVLTVLTGGSFGVASVASSLVVGEATHMVALKLFAALLSGIAVDSYLRGPAFADYANYGARLSANSVGTSRGGAMLSPQESGAIQAVVDGELNAEFAALPLKDRLFDPYNSRSLAAKVLDVPDPKLAGNMAKISSSITHFGKMFSSIPLLFTSPVKAASGTYNYGFPEYGFSIGDMENPMVANPYQNAAQVPAILSGSNGFEYIARAKSCFGVNIGTTTIDGQAVLSATASSSSGDMPNPYEVTSNNNPHGNAESGTEGICGQDNSDWLRVRFFIFDSLMMDAASCYEESDADSCEHVGFSPVATNGGGGGIVDCNNAGDPGTWGDQSAGTLSNYNAEQYRGFIERYAPARTCPGSMFPNFQTPSNATPNDPNRQYFASCSDNCALRPLQDASQMQGNACGGATWYGAGNYVRVKYRNPPRGSNTICIPTFNSSISPPGTQEPPPGSPPPPPGCGLNDSYKIGPSFGSMFLPKAIFGIQTC